MTQPVKLCLLPPSHSGPVCFRFVGPAQAPFHQPGPHLTPTPYGNARMVLHDGTLYLSLAPGLELNEVDRDRAAALGYTTPLLPGPGWLSSDPGGPMV